MLSFNSEKIAEKFCRRYGIMPTAEEKIFIRLAILEGAVQQLQLDKNELKNKTINEKKDVDMLAQEGVISAVKKYGIEGAEQKIKKVYSRYPKIMKTMLEAWKQIYFRKEK